MFKNKNTNKKNLLKITDWFKRFFINVDKLDLFVNNLYDVRLRDITKTKPKVV